MYPKKFTQDNIIALFLLLSAVIILRHCNMAVVTTKNKLSRNVTSASFLAVISRLILSAVCFPTFCSAYEVTCVIIKYFNRFCYLLTYLLSSLAMFTNASAVDVIV